MCNLSIGVYKNGYDEGLNHGILEGREEGRETERREITLTMLQNHMPVDLIVRITAQPEESVRRIAEEEHIVIGEQ